jgi:hypothetical protein
MGRGRSLRPELVAEANYKIGTENSNDSAASIWLRGEGQKKNESPSIGKENLREVQGHQPPRGGQGDLRKREAQTAPGLIACLVRGGNSKTGAS